MQVQKIRFSDQKIGYTVLDGSYLPVTPISEFLVYLSNVERSPNTVLAYAHHLKLFWTYLTEETINWKMLNIAQLARFVRWLREKPYQRAVIHLTEQDTYQTNIINTILAAITSFYRFHQQMEHTTVDLVKKGYFRSTNRYKGLLYHAYKHQPVQQRVIALKPFRQLPKTISQTEYQALLENCHLLRDKFLLMLLYETGMRIGQALGLHHEDIISWDNEIRIVRRQNNINNALSKSSRSYTVHVSPMLIQTYNEYIYSLKNKFHPDYVFVNSRNYQPLRYANVNKLFCRLSKIIGHKVTAHMFRHTHATALLRAGWDSALIQKRLGHSDVQTTIKTYSHFNDNDLKQAFHQYLASLSS